MPLLQKTAAAAAAVATAWESSSFISITQDIVGCLISHRTCVHKHICSAHAHVLLTHQPAHAAAAAACAVFHLHRIGSSLSPAIMDYAVEMLTVRVTVKLPAPR